MTLQGRGSILPQLAEHGLIDEYQIMIDPVAIGEGTTIFKGVKLKPDLNLGGARTIRSGVILLCNQHVSNEHPQSA